MYSQWNAAFGTPPSSSASQSSPPLRAPSSGTYDPRGGQDITPQAYPAQSPYSPHSGQIQGMQANLPPPTSYAAPAPGYVTPTMWQDVVANSFSDGLKRRWDYGNQAAMAQMAKRQR